MPFFHVHYLPIGWPLFALLLLAIVVLAILIQIQVLHSVYMSLGVSSGVALLLLVGTLIGSTINVPLAQLYEPRLTHATEIDAFGEAYETPAVVDWPGTVIAANVGGALIPAAMSLYLLLRFGFWGRGLLAVAFVAFVCHAIARPVAGLGVAMPALVPGLTAGVTGLVLSRRLAAPIAYVSGSLGVLIGADLMNLGKLETMGASVASIGGAGTFDGIFLTGVIAVIIASLSPFHQAARAERRSN
jgi:uncharacterized membrane protein